MKTYRKMIALALSFLAFAIIVGFVYNGYSQLNSYAEKKEAIKRIPKIQLIQLDETTISLSNFVKDKSLLLIYYSSDCPFCEHSFRYLKEHITSFSEYSILAISKESLNKIYSFRMKMGLEETPQIVFLQDYLNEFHDNYIIKTIPTYFIYNREGILLIEKQGSGFLKELTKEKHP